LTKTILERNIIEELVVEKQMLLVELAEKHSTNLELRKDTNYKGIN